MTGHRRWWQLVLGAGRYQAPAPAARAGARRVPHGAQAAIDRREGPIGDFTPETLVIHVADEDLFVLVDAFDKEALEQALEHQGELVLGIRGGGFAQSVIGDGGLDDLIEEELVGLVEVRAESLIDDVDQLGERNGLVAGDAGADLSGPIEHRGASRFRLEERLPHLRAERRKSFRLSDPVATARRRRGVQSRPVDAMELPGGAG